MGILKMVVWTAAAVGLGIFLSSYSVHGHTPLEQAKRMWQQSPAPDALGHVTEDVQDAVENAKDHLRHETKPHEHHSDSDRDALNKLIAKGERHK